MPPAREADTGNCIVLVTPDAERTFVSWPGIEGVAGVALAADSFGPGDWIVLTGYMLRYPGSRDAFLAVTRARDELLVVVAAS